MSGYFYIFHKAEMFHLARLQGSENPKLASYFYIFIRRLLERIRKLTAHIMAECCSVFGRSSVSLEQNQTSLWDVVKL